MVPVHCPACKSQDDAAILCLVPHDVPREDVIRFEDRRPEDVLYLCDVCPKCGGGYCVRILRKAA